MRYGKLAVALLAAGAFSLMADQLKLNDGSVINGTIAQFLNGKVKIKTAFAGDLEIEADKIASMKTDAEVNVSTSSAKFTGTFTEDGIRSGNNVIPVNYGDLKAVWNKGEDDPTIPKVEGRKWKYEATLDITGKTGNTEKHQVGAGFKATMTGPVDKLVLYLKNNYTRDSGVETEREFIAGFDYEHRIAERSSTWYIKSEYEYDKFNDMDPSITSAAGYGFYALDQEDYKIRLRVGLSHIYRKYISDHDTDSTVGMELAYHHEFKIHKFLGMDNFGTLVTDLTYTPGFDNFKEDYRIYHESSLALPLGGSKFWTLRLGVSNDYHSRVGRGVKHTDTTYFTKLVLNWE